jgi:hypothetical protein
MTESSVEKSIFNWFDEPIKKSVHSVFDGINKTVESLDLFRRFRSAHHTSLLDQVGRVKVLGMSTSINLSDLYYPASVSADIRRRLYEEEWFGQSGLDKPPSARRSPSIDATAYAEKSSRLVVLGGPGAGKTTFLKFLALAYSDRSIFGTTKLKRSLIPFYIHLPDYAESKVSVLEYMSKVLVDTEGEYALAFVQRVLKKGWVAILFDSLDEVKMENRDLVVFEIESFCKSYPKNKAVVSCRTADYSGSLRAFDEVELARLSKAAVGSIVRSWFNPDVARANELIAVIDQDRGLSSLTETPLLLSLLCIQFRHDLALPRRKVEVYRRCIETLLRDWDSSRGFRRETKYESLTDDHKEGLFEHIAGSTLRAFGSYVISRDAVFSIAGEYIEKCEIDRSEAPKVIDEVERHHGIIERHSVDAFCFAHSSMHDYFAAKKFISDRIEKEIIRDRAEDDSWAGVIEFMCAVFPRPGELLQLLMNKAKLGNLRNYPAIERRAKLLNLIYRCMTLRPAMDASVRTEVFVYIATSISKFCEVISDTNVYPMCAYTGSGVRQPYMYSGPRRPSLNNTLLPFRRLANEILVDPVLGYAEIAKKMAEEVISAGRFEVLDVSICLNLVIPLSRCTGREVLELLIALDKGVKENARGAWLSSVINESVMALSKQGGGRVQSVG